MLAVKGTPEEMTTSIQYLARRLFIQHNSAVELVNRSAKKGLVERRLGQTGMRILTRLMGLVLCAIAAQFIIDGIKLSGLVSPNP